MVLIGSKSKRAYFSGKKKLVALVIQSAAWLWLTLRYVASQLQSSNKLLHSPGVQIIPYLTCQMKSGRTGVRKICSGRLRTWLVWKLAALFFLVMDFFLNDCWQEENYMFDMITRLWCQKLPCIIDTFCIISQVSAAPGVPTSVCRSTILLQTEIFQQLSDGLRFWENIYCPQRMNHNHFGDPLTFNPVPSRLTFLVLTYLNNYGVDCHGNWCTHSCPPQEEFFKQLWWFLHFSSNAITSQNFQLSSTSAD